MDKPDSTALAAARGDAAAFAMLVREHQGRLRGFLRRMTRGDAALADDLAQEAFLEAWRKVATFRGDGTFAGWLYAIAYSRYLMEARKRKLEPLGDTDELAIESEPARNAKLDLEKALARIHPAERAALTLCYALEFSHSEAAQVLGIPVGTLKSHVLRGREKMRTILGPEAT